MRNGRLREITAGECYRKVGALSQVWEVERMIAEIDGIRHFRLRDTRYPSNTIVISERALLNRRYFEPVQMR